MSATAAMDQYTIVGSAGATVWVYRDANGNIQERESTQEERALEIVPPKGEYVLRVKAFGQPYEAQTQWGPKTKTRLLLEIQGGPGNGKRISSSVGWAISPKSSLGKVYVAITGEAIDKGGQYDVTRILEGDFQAYVTQSDELNEAGRPKYANITWDTVGAVGATNGGAADDWN